MVTLKLARRAMVRTDSRMNTALRLPSLIAALTVSVLVSCSADKRGVALPAPEQSRTAASAGIGERLADMDSCEILREVTAHQAHSASLGVGRGAVCVLLELDAASHWEGIS